ncbi:MAG: universal stress protein, partial [Chloroflexi bacterium]|nr:universal stress protein [Chloroflexota bacterium]
LQAAGLEVEVLPPHFGIAAEEILRTERQIRPDMIIIEAPWLSAFRRLFNRDFSERIVRQAKAPVLTVRPTDDIKERYIAPLVMDAYPHPVAA